MIKQIKKVVIASAIASLSIPAAKASSNSQNNTKLPTHTQVKESLSKQLNANVKNKQDTTTQQAIVEYAGIQTSQKKSEFGRNKETEHTWFILHLKKNEAKKLIEHYNKKHKGLIKGYKKLKKGWGEIILDTIKLYNEVIPKLKRNNKPQKQIQIQITKPKKQKSKKTTPQQRKKQVTTQLTIPKPKKDIHISTKPEVKPLLKDIIENNSHKKNKQERKKVHNNEDEIKEDIEESNKYDSDGYDSDGYNRKGYKSNGFNKLGIHKDTGTPYNLDGYNQIGFDIYGYNKLGYDII